MITRQDSFLDNKYGGNTRFQTILNDYQNSAIFVAFRLYSVILRRVLVDLHDVLFNLKFVGAKLKNKMADVEEKENFIASATHKKPKQSASLVTDVLLKSSRLEKEDINSCVKKTLQKAEEVKVKCVF